jgi:Carbohydrate binding module (family 6)
VDIQNTEDAGGGNNVGWTAGGEWLKYTLNATVDGIYSLRERVAPQGNAGTFHGEIDGQDVTGVITGNDTLGWQIYQTLKRRPTSASAPVSTKFDCRWTPLAATTRLAIRTISSSLPRARIRRGSSSNPPPILRGAFVGDGSARVHTITKTIVVPKNLIAHFYRLRSALPTRIPRVQIVGTNVVITYQ